MVVSSDHKEIFTDELLPAFAVYWGETVAHEPFTQEHLDAMPPGLSIAEVANVPAESRTRPCHSELALHLIRATGEAGFDAGASKELPAGRYGNHGIPHGWGFVLQQVLGGESELPIVPVFVNTFWQPNPPSARRCYEFGVALGDAIRSFPADLRVGVVASGGLSHFVIDEELDRAFLDALVDADADFLSGLPADLLRSGTSELRNWIVVGGALVGSPLAAQVVDYLPVLPVGGRHRLRDGLRGLAGRRTGDEGTTAPRRCGHERCLDRRAGEGVRRLDRRRAPGPGHRPGRVRHPAGAQRLRQDDHAALPRRAGGARRRARSASPTGSSSPPARGTFVPPDKRDIGMVFQSYALWPHMTVADNVGYPLQAGARSPRPRSREQVVDVLDRVGLAERIDAMATSAVRRAAAARGPGPRDGQPARAAAVRRAAVQPRRQAARRRCGRRSASCTTALGITSVYVTHDQEEASRWPTGSW